MSLYQPSVLKQHLKLQDQQILDKAYKKYSKYFLNPTIQDNIRSSKEEEYQGIFLTELFVNILGYTLKPKADFNLVAEYKNQNNARKADGAILNDDVAIGVIELKGTNTKDLESIRKQAFDYKANQKGCIYVIASNFEKLRFYINDATEFEEFNLFELPQERFELLYLCLQKDNVLNNVPLNLKEASLVEEEKITKQFYKDYSLFKRELYRDLVKRNAKRLKNEASLRGTKQSHDEASEEEKALQQQLEKNVKLTLFKKSQKLIDRFLFIFFAEDRGLLPPNSTLQIIDKWKADVDFGDERPLYNRFKQYFKFLDHGRQGTSSRAEIYAYNGGLFKEDALLDSLELDDALLSNHTYKLASYDFESQVDVNILGHIFENSLNEIESVNAEIEGGEFDKQKSKRKKDGVFYTPKYITKYIVENTVGKLCNEKKVALGFKEEEYFKGRKNRNKSTITKLVTVLDDYRDWLLQLTICDPACGSGAFLNQALDFLIKEHNYIDELKTKVLGGGLQFPDIENTILENNIYGLDLNEESVEIAKLSLWLRTAQPRRKLNNLSRNIKCGNSLIDSKAVAGDKAFNWQEQFPNVFKEQHKKAYHITTAIHDSRTSKRMETYKVREHRDMGTNPFPNVVYFTPEDDLIISQTIADIVKEDEINLLAYNICADHIHLLLVCELEDIPAIMQKMKGRTSYTRGLSPLQKENEKETAKKPLWQQKYSPPKEITTEAQLQNTIRYIQTNRSKHELPAHSKTLQTVIDNMCCTINQAFKPEYKGGFDVVIGNPPYVRSRELFSEVEKNFYIKNYSTTSYQLDLYKLFIEKSCALINLKGKLSFITPSVFLTNDYDKPLRKFILDNFSLETIATSDKDIFDDASVKTVTFLISHFKQNNLVKFHKIDKGEFHFEKSIKQNAFIEQNYLINEKLNITALPIIRKLNRYEKIGKYFDVKNGIKVRKDLLYETKKDENHKPFILGKNIHEYYFTYNDIYIDYKSENEKLYTNQAFRTKEIFEQNKLITRQILGKRIMTCFDKHNHYTDQTTYVINNNIKGQELKYLLCILNSKLIYYYFINTFSDNKTTFPKVKRSQLLELPYHAKSEQKYFVDRANKKINQVTDFNSVTEKYIKYLQQTFKFEKLTRKLQNWHKLNFADFIKELNKAIKKTGGEKLTKKDEFEWLELFEDNKQKAQELQHQINQTEKEIDAIIYELYGLSEEEIKIVENR